MQLNLTKGVVAIAFLVLTIILTRDTFPSITPLPLILLLLSGIAGIGLGDTAFFAAINSLGPRRALLMGTLAPPMTALGALIFLQESLNVSAWCGILLTIVGVAWVVTERVPGISNTSPGQLWRGITFGILAALAQAIGAVLSRSALTSTSISPLWAALLRLGAGVSILLPWTYLARGQYQFQIKTLQSPRLIVGVCVAAFLGTYLGIWLQQTAIKLTAVGIASTLMQTSPLFILPLAMWMGEKVTWRAIFGVVIALAGVAILFYWR